MAAIPAPPKRLAATAGRRLAFTLGALSALLLWGAAQAASGAAPARLVARSPDFRLVGLLHDDTMSLRVSRTLDDAPVSNATVIAEFRGRSYPATATIDGGYTFRAPDLAVPGAAAFAFRVTVAGKVETLRGMLRQPATQHPGNSRMRQLGWWVLNFSVCIGFLALLARRRKRTES
ncbi:MAG TPA: hypothetical protein VMU86_01190 [Steroidobacteraceae bacterium]|nr:hypothetical protein [Steroidobacteraceae bacterium]